MKTISVLKNGVLAAILMATMSISASAAVSGMKVLVVISKVSQHMTVTVDGQKQYDWLVSTGGRFIGLFTDEYLEARRAIADRAYKR